jgi:hypothetical protein
MMLGLWGLGVIGNITPCLAVGRASAAGSAAAQVRVDSGLQGCLPWPAGI